MKKKGFTLVELLAVIAILAILVIIALPNVLKMFNDSKKNSFLTEAKTVYSEVSKKYISESMKGNKLSYISSEDNTKLDMTGKKLQYCVLLNSDGSVKSMKVSNGTWVAELSGNKKITDLKSSDLKDGNLDNEECVNVNTVSFEKDSWDTIENAVRTGQTSNYHVGDEKEVDLGTYGKHKVRIANMSTPSECNQEGFSQSACGFVVEFTNMITKHVMNLTSTNIGGWPSSDMYKFLNDESDSNSIIKSLPNELKSVIIDTKTVSGNSKKDTNIFISSFDKLYLLSTAEVWKNGQDADKSTNKTRQLDYYENKGVTTRNYTDAAKNDDQGKSGTWWWLRCAYADGDIAFYAVGHTGDSIVTYANSKNGVSPAFRIG